MFSARGVPSGGSDCIAALLRAFEALPPGAALTAAGVCAADAVSSNGLLAPSSPPASWRLAPSLFLVGAMLEKPMGAASSVLSRFAAPPVCEVAARASYICNFGIDVLPHGTLDTLETLAAGALQVWDAGVIAQRCELGLREAMHPLLAEGRLYGLLMRGYERHDLGNPVDYWATMLLFSGAPAGARR